MVSGLKNSMEPQLVRAAAILSRRYLQHPIDHLRPQTFWVLCSLIMEYDVPTVTILLLGDAEVGKSTFLSYVSLHARFRARRS